MPTIPSFLDGRYELHAVLAARADAVTVMATDEILQRDVWITMLLDPDDERRATFRHHAEALARRAVDGAPRVYDGSMRVTQPYVVTQPAPDGDPSALLDVLTDDDTPTAELPIIARPPSPATATTAPLATVGNGHDRGSAGVPRAAAWRRASAAAMSLTVSRRRMLIAGICGVLLLSGSTFAMWVASNGDAPALAEHMPVVVGVDVTEDATDPDGGPELERTTSPTAEPETEPPMQAHVAEQPDPPPPPQPEPQPQPDAEPQPEAVPAPQAPADPPGHQDRDKDKGSSGESGEKGGGPPDHAKAKGRGN